jgi:cysteinyl-tRNA synthetase
MTRAKEEFVPQVPGKVGMYVCGVTVYDVCHIGHARVYVAFDVIQRWLRQRGFEVTYVRNFTDVDDKIIKRSNEAGVGVTELTDRFIGEFRRDMELLGVAAADVEPRVTDHMQEIIAMIARIIERGHAYAADGDVYYDIGSFPGYLGLSGRKLDDMQAGASDRVDASEADPKRHPLDFALWKSAKPGEPAWESPWGPGRPGWHIECSAMSEKYLGQVFDIHGGGADLVFPHHENERAQSWACSGEEFVRYWMHNGFVKVDGEKMSKSLGNFFAIREVLARFHPESLRYFLLSVHYRSPINFYDGAIADAENRVEYLYEAIAAARAFIAAAPAQPVEADLQKLMDAFGAGLDDDFNTSAALASLADAARGLNESLALKGKDPTKGPKVATFLEALGRMGIAMGLCQRDPAEVVGAIQALKLARSGLERDAIEALVAERTEARKAKDFARGDVVRARLLELGVQVMDTPEGTRWKLI